MVAPWIKMPTKRKKKATPVQPPPTAGDITPPPVAWSPDDKKAVLIEAATQRGLETTGLTKAQIIELLRSE
tara:strand:- start:531 stop:743 length:213 start_codon:yes stop_codon:yes gene_type:complete